ncbi:hypothetical protein ACUOFC_38135, partial [Escherichia sp. TWPC-MK]
MGKSIVNTAIEFPISINFSDIPCRTSAASIKLFISSFLLISAIPSAACEPLRPTLCKEFSNCFNVVFAWFNLVSS